MQESLNNARAAIGDSTIGFIGAGNMAASLIGGLLDQGVPAQQICAAELFAERRQQVEDQYQIFVSDNSAAIAERADVLILAVKPQDLATVCQQLREPIAKRNPVILSVAAGITTELMQDWLGTNQAIVRTMPNTPALVGAGAAGLFANPNVSATQRAQAQAIMGAVGLACWVEDESQMDIVTALSGSGPAYFFLVMEALADAAVEAGLDQATAQQLTQQTALGAARLIVEQQADAAVLRRQVTSPKGTTEAAVNALEQGGLRDLFKQGIDAAHRRGQELAEQMSQPQ